MIGLLRSKGGDRVRQSDAAGGDPNLNPDVTACQPRPVHSHLSVKGLKQYTITHCATRQVVRTSSEGEEPSGCTLWDRQVSVGAGCARELVALGTQEQGQRIGWCLSMGLSQSEEVTRASEGV